MLLVVDEPFVVVVEILAGASVDALVVKALGALVDELVVISVAVSLSVDVLVVRALGALVDEPVVKSVDVLVVGFVGSIDDAGVNSNVRFWQFTCLRYSKTPIRVFELEFFFREINIKIKFNYTYSLKEQILLI